MYLLTTRAFALRRLHLTATDSSGTSRSPGTSERTLPVRVHRAHRWRAGYPVTISIAARPARGRSSSPRSEARCGPTVALAPVADGIALRRTRWLLYDTFAASAGVPPDSSRARASGVQFDRLGWRVAILLSPWVAAGRIDHTVYDHTAVPRRSEMFRLRGFLTAQDAARESSTVGTCRARGSRCQPARPGRQARVARGEWFVHRRISAPCRRALRRWTPDQVGAWCWTSCGHAPDVPTAAPVAPVSVRHHRVSDVFARRPCPATCPSATSRSSRLRGVRSLRVGISKSVDSTRRANVA